MNQQLNKIVFGAVLVLGMTSPARADENNFRVLVDRDRSELVFILGPVNLPTGGHDKIEQPKTQTVAVPVTGYFHGFTVEMVDAGGNILPSELLHHVNIMMPSRRELFSNIMQRVGAAGAETGPIQFPRLLGYPVTRGDSLIFTLMLNNPTTRSFENVEMRLRMKYSASPIMPTLTIYPFHLDVMPPAGIHAYTLPPGKSSRSWEAKPAVAGRIVALGGHLHQFGTALRLEDVTTGKIIWEAKPILDANGKLIGMPRAFFFRRLGIQLNPTHVYRVTAEYENPTNEPIEHGAMGTLGGILVPDDRMVWPAADRTHPDYLADLDVMYPKAGAGAHHHH